MRNTPLRAFAKKSPVYKKGDFDFSKKADYSKEKLKGNIGSRIAKAITPENSIKGLIGSMVPIGKAAKIGKAAYNYFKGDKKA
jgi:hypothetical protein